MLRYLNHSDIESATDMPETERLVPEPSPPMPAFMPDDYQDDEISLEDAYLDTYYPLLQHEHNRFHGLFETSQKSFQRPPAYHGNLLIAERNKSQFSHRIHRPQPHEMRIGSRKRHVVGASTQFADNAIHPTIQAKQNQMYLITTLLPSQCEQPALINRVLPKELLLRIFSCLDIVTLCKCAQVCRIWNRLAMDGSNWQRVDLFEFQKDIKASVVENLAQRCGGFLKELSLKGCENVQDSAMRSFAAKCPNIEALALSKCKYITDVTSLHLGKYCHRITYLDLENCSALTDRSLKSLGEGCQRLTELNISWCTNVTDEGVRHIIMNCPNLETLICKGCRGLSLNCFSDLQGKMGSVKTLNLLSCIFFNDVTVEAIAQSCPLLEYLCLSNCSDITDRSLQALALGCPLLKDLELASCVNLTDAGFISLSKNCHELERMDLEDCIQITDTSVVNLNSGCPNLNSLALSHCDHLTDNGLAELCQTHKDIMKVLELDNCSQLTDAALDLMKPMKNLERVDLYDCQHITKDAIRKFKQVRPDVDVHAYFAPASPPAPVQPQRRGICKCCAIL
ncbi:unnamed protein product [Bursaphelenchus okinawaensis]|uniref:F-box domain-containing protein n=1 Tax=Bursaphelenchus okinawaensis TaxID=465554 RepID=A0A811KHW5_9BILA|nr:unnamed protein product [Bursaphelenchus okinawaensis]CAG9103421.1 unnamed protein product [Bursaphelenchus okinawaensis]